MNSDFDPALNPNYKTDASPSWSYEATVVEVEAIIAQIEAGELDLAAVMDQFAQAMAHLRQCEDFLSDRQRQMDLLVEELQDEPNF